MTSNHAAWQALLEGRQLGEYQLGTFLGDGNFGLVFEAQHVVTNATVAVKVLLPSVDSEASFDFSNEGVLLKKLNTCSNVISISDSGTETIFLTGNGVQVPTLVKFHALGLASGSLDELTRNPTALADLDWLDRLTLWRGAIKGAHQMHLKSVVHRDIKSDNCLLVADGAGRLDVRLADLGRAKDMAVASNLTAFAYAQGRGDKRFAAPEHLLLQGGSSAQDFKNADVFALGSLLVEMTTGHPFTSLAFSSSWRDVVAESVRLRATGQARDLRTLRGPFRQALAAIEPGFPKPIRQDLAALLLVLLDPVPSDRRPKSARRRDAGRDPGLLWLIRRADILSRQLEVHRKQTARSTKGRSA